ncbi:DNA independent RNA polymerase I transcription factor [Saitoella coloradoensis]
MVSIIPRTESSSSTTPSLELPNSNGGTSASKTAPAETETDAKLSQTMFLAFVSNALDARLKGDYSPFEDLQRLFTVKPTAPDAPSSSQLRQILGALTNHVSRLDSSASILVRAIIGCHWAGRDDLFVGAYVRFLGNLVSAHAGYIPLVTHMLVQHLSLVPISLGRLPNHDPVPRSLIHDRAHFALQYILELVPTATPSLMPVLSAEFPHKSENKLAQVTYVTNLLRVLQYAPVLRGQVMNLLIDKIIQIDVEIQVNLDELDDEHEILEEDVPNGISDANFMATAKEGPHAQLLAEIAEADAADLDEDDDEDLEMSVQNIKDMVDKLDCMLMVMFDYLTPTFLSEPALLTPGGIMNSEVFSDISFEHLLQAFDTTILSTFRSRYTQFIIFWASQTSPRFIDAFLGVAIERALDPSRPQIARQAASAYVASFVARAKKLDRPAVRTVVGMLCTWLHTYIEDREEECVGADVGKFGGFYAVVQAVFYIFCFRWRELKGDDEENEDVMEGEDGETDKWAPGLEVLNRAILSRFNPLKVCSPVVVSQFARVANHLGLLYAYSVMEQNRRLGGAGNYMNANLNKEVESYFPFDPYRLKRSQGYVKDMYVEWQNIPGLDDEDEDEDEDEDDESEDEYDEDMDESMMD